MSKASSTPIIATGTIGTPAVSAMCAKPVRPSHLSTYFSPLRRTASRPPPGKTITASPRSSSARQLPRVPRTDPYRCRKCRTPGTAMSTCSARPRMSLPRWRKTSGSSSGASIAPSRLWLPTSSTDPSAGMLSRP
ncbi:Uncharacterised protein [Mycobacteroides abscessus subsp. abscessus]|nr:Uncharacterised protein [Mycobacteroides abscessus subsp. abscessus]